MGDVLQNARTSGRGADLSVGLLTAVSLAVNATLQNVAAATSHSGLWTWTVT